MYKLAGIFALYVGISALLFPFVYEASSEVIDEEFHLRQGLAYCRGEFDVVSDIGGNCGVFIFIFAISAQKQWDPKITTFPGLYIVSTVLNYALGTCTIWTMRLTSLLASCLNVWLIYQIRCTVLEQQPASPAKSAALANAAFETLAIALLPPLYFFAHLYYTDVLSLTAILALILFNMRSQHTIAALCGAAAVLMRQTNIVWVAMALGTTCIDKLVSQTLPFIKQNERYGRSDHVYGFRDVAAVLLFYARRVYLVPKQVRLLVTHLCGYVLVLVAFVGFVAWNGSIVVGDKAAHTASLHAPQLLYFALFVLVFGVAVWPPLLPQVLHNVRAHWFRWAAVTAACTLAVALNTIEHPYLLADNRHYTFYVWNRFYGAHAAARFAAVPAYVLGLAAIDASLAANRTAGFRGCLTVCTVAALCFQQLIEVRYFLVPYMWVRLHAGPVGRWWLLAELLWCAALNGGAFYVFGTKEIYWADFEAVQRLIW